MDNNELVQKAKFSNNEFSEDYQIQNVQNTQVYFKTKAA